MSLSHGSASSERVIGAAIEVHRQLGPGLLESAYEECLCFELKRSGIDYLRQVALPIRYKAITLDCGYRMDVVIGNELVVEIKAIDRLLPIHDAQMLTYLRLGGYRVGLLMNFNTMVLKDDLKRIVFDLAEPPCSPCLRGKADRSVECRRY